MGNKAIQVENLGKAYQLGQIGTGTISRDLERWWTTKVRGKEDPYLRIGETNDRTSKGESNIVWSLQDINFSIEQGDAVGIIGRNGAGKSTLLKLLSRVTAPTTGNIKVKGRIASLLEVGTGFHPELSGRENIYLNGAILGMRKKEIDRKFDEIVDFSGVERYVDTPVKRYSSGMYVRLAFAVAAHLESEILIVDEVLAVGDAEFQKKCLGKMGEVSKGEGRTVLFVSHNMGAVQSLCNKGVLLKNGMLEFQGGIASTISNYLSSKQTNLNYLSLNSEGSFIRKIDIISESESIFWNEDFQLLIELKIQKKIAGLRLGIDIYDSWNNRVTTIDQSVNNISGDCSFVYTIEKEQFTPGNYYFDFVLHVPNQLLIDHVKRGLGFSIEGNDFELAKYYDLESHSIGPMITHFTTQINNK